MQKNNTDVLNQMNDVKIEVDTGFVQYKEIKFQYIPAYSSIFQYIPVYSSIFQYIPAYSSIFQYIPVYSSIFQLFQYIPGWTDVNVQDIPDAVYQKSLAINMPSSIYFGAFGGAFGSYPPPSLQPQPCPLSPHP